MQTGWVQGEDDLWFWAQEKSNENQEVGAEFIEDIESNRERTSGKGKEKRVSLNFAWGLEFY